MKKEVENTEFWRQRILKNVAEGRPIHFIIYDCAPLLWQENQIHTGHILRRHVPEGSKVLDAGCGYGALIDCLTYVNLKVNYLGIDFSPDLLELARLRYPNHSFQLADMRDIPYDDLAFDFAVLRSIKDMIIDNESVTLWDTIFQEVSRVSRRQIIIEYSEEEGQTPNYVVTGSM